MESDFFVSVNNRNTVLPPGFFLKWKGQPICPKRCRVAFDVVIRLKLPKVRKLMRRHHRVLIIDPKIRAMVSVLVNKEVTSK